MTDFYKMVKESAERLDFTITEHKGNNNRKLYTLVTNWSYVLNYSPL